MKYQHRYLDFPDKELHIVNQIFFAFCQNCIGIKAIIPEDQKEIIWTYKEYCNDCPLKKENVLKFINQS
jgi:hypothetical protein